MRTIAMLHTARATVPMMTAMIEGKYPEVKVSNWLDDSILPALTEDENNIEYASDIVKVITPLGVVGTANYFISLGVDKPQEEIVSRMKEYMLA